MELNRFDHYLRFDWICVQLIAESNPIPNADNHIFKHTNKNVF